MHRQFHFLPILAIFLCHFFHNLHANPTDDGDTVSVQTSSGLIRGKLRQVDVGQGQPGLDIDVFLGIPYAQVPIGPLRFEKTEPIPANSSEVVDAFEHRHVCVPHHRRDNWYHPDLDDYSEDCLYLNVFAPHRQQQQQEQKLLPILLLIYSGGFELQSMRRYKNFTDIGQKYLSRGIVVMAVQFRIGYMGDIGTIFAGNIGAILTGKLTGFSSTGDAQMPGNLGYWDIAEALKWIHANGHAFGGDPYRMTLFGYSSGSAAVTTLGIAPETRDLFQQAIQLSGSIFTSRAANNRVISITRDLASLMGCPEESSALKQCFRQKSIDEFMNAMDKKGSSVPDVNYDLFGPVMDNDFLPRDFVHLIEETKQKPTILGVTELDPLYFTLLMKKNNSLRELAIPHDEQPGFGINQFRDYLRQKVVKAEYFGQRQEKMLARIEDFYLGYDRPTQVDNWFFLERIVHIFDDIQFVAPLVGELRAKQSWPLFLYMSKFVNPRRLPADFKIQKSFHDNDHGYMFHDPYSSYQFDDSDRKMEALMVDVVANFVLTGNPSSASMSWPPTSTATPFQCLEIDVPQPRVNAAGCFSLDRVQFWEQMAAEFPEYNLVMGQPGNCTQPCGNSAMTISPTCFCWTIWSAFGMVAFALLLAKGSDSRRLLQPLIV